MRRSKIKPSINLASRRSVSTASQPKDKGTVGAPQTAPDAAPKPSQEHENDHQKPRERRLSQTQRTDAASNKEASGLITEVAPVPASLPLQDTTQQQDSAPQPGNVPKENGEQSTDASIPAAGTTSLPSEAQETGSKVGSSAVKRKRFSAVPNLGQPRLRPSGHRSEAKAAKASSEVNSHQEQKENEETVDVVKRPPPVQRVLTVPTANKKGGATSPAIKAKETEAQKSAAVKKTVEVVPVPKIPKASSALTTKTPEIQVPGDSKTSEVDGKKSGLQANVYSKKLKELKDQMNEETPSKRRKRHARSTSPDRAKMTMGDLIYYNPRTNPMKVSEADKQNKKAKTETTQKKKVTFNEEDQVEDIDDDTSSTGTMAPQVKIGPDGEIIIDQTSLYVEASPVKAFDPMDSEVVHEDSSNTTYSSFLKRKRTAAWTAKDTRRFYLALSSVGTDFATINVMFPARTRAEIKRKFKKEERQNRKKVDLALLDRKELDMSLFDPPSDDSDGESVVDADKKKKSGSLKEKNTSKKNGEMNDDDLADDVEEQIPEVADVAENGSLSSVQEETEEQINLENILSTTRSGRQPKARTSFTIQIPPKVNRKRTRASPSQNPNALKVFDDYAKHRIQRLQSEHEATMTLKRLARNEVARDPEEESEDGRSDMASDMMSEVGSEFGNDEVEGIEHPGLTNNLQPMRVFQRNSPLAAGPSSSQLTAGGSGGGVGFSSPESINDPSVKKVTLMITTPDGKQTLVQVNLASDEEVALSGAGSPQGVSSEARLGAGENAHNLPRAGALQMHAGGFRSPQTSSHQLSTPARTLTTLANVSSPYQRDSPLNQKIRTQLSTGETQPSKQSKNVTVAKIVDGKIVFCPPQSEASLPSPGANKTVKSSPSVQRGLSSSPHIPHQQSSTRSLQTHEGPERTYVNVPKSTAATSTVIEQPPAEAPTIPIIAENMSTDNLLTVGSLPDLDMSMTFAGNLGMVAYEESIETMGDHIVAQQVNVASSDVDGVVPRQKRKLKSHEPFIPPIK